MTNILVLVALNNRVGSKAYVCPLALAGTMATDQGMSSTLAITLHSKPRRLGVRRSPGDFYRLALPKEPTKSRIGLQFFAHCRQRVGEGREPFAVPSAPPNLGADTTIGLDKVGALLEAAVTEEASCVLGRDRIERSSHRVHQRSRGHLGVPSRPAGYSDHRAGPLEGRGTCRVHAERDRGYAGEEAAEKAQSA